jgi:hypothetical protein
LGDIIPPHLIHTLKRGGTTGRGKRARGTRIGGELGRFRVFVERSMRWRLMVSVEACVFKDSKQGD